MPTTFTFADTTVTTLLRTVMEKHHNDLFVADVAIGVLMANNSEGSPLKAHGYPATALIKVLNPADRLSKRYEAELRIDAMDWTDLEHESRLALLDHELAHIALDPLKGKELAFAKANFNDKKKKAEEAGSEPPVFVWWKMDGRGRPKLKSVKGDWYGSDGFFKVVERHGLAALEVRNAGKVQKFVDEAMQRRAEATKSAGKPKKEKA